MGQEKIGFQVHFHAFHNEHEKFPGMWSTKQGYGSGHGVVDCTAQAKLLTPTRSLSDISFLSLVCEVQDDTEGRMLTSSNVVEASNEVVGLDAPCNWTPRYSLGAESRHQKGYAILPSSLRLWLQYSTFVPSRYLH
jgi:hypothetical protein